MHRHIDHIDTDLFSRLSQGDEAAFRQIVFLSYQKMLPFTISLVKSESEARDVLQEVFLKLWVNRTTLSGIQYPSTWLSAVLANTAYNHLRTRLRYELKIKNLANQSPSTDAVEILDDLELKSTQRFIDEAVNRLPGKRKEIFLLSRREGLSRREIALQLNISEHTVRNQLSEAIKFIQNYLRLKGNLIIPSILILQDFLAR